jgi:hypothetical protein
MSLSEWVALGIGAGILTTFVVLFWKMATHRLKTSFRWWSNILAQIP